MPLTAAQTEQIADFRAAVEARLADDARLGPPERVDRADGSTLATRCAVAANLWIEVALRPSIPQMRAGIVTDDRWLSEDLEQAIEDSGDTMAEFVELGFDEVDLHWPQPPVEHYRDQGTHFYFATAVDLPDLDGLADAATVDKLVRMALGYCEAFRASIEKRAGESDA